MTGLLTPANWAWRKKNHTSFVTNAAYSLLYLFWPVRARGHMAERPFHLKKWMKTDKHKHTNMFEGQTVKLLLLQIQTTDVKTMGFYSKILRASASTVSFWFSFPCPCVVIPNMGSKMISTPSKLTPRTLHTFSPDDPTCAQMPFWFLPCPSCKRRLLQM